MKVSWKKWSRFTYRLSAHGYSRKTTVYAPDEASALLGSGKIDRENAALVHKSTPVVSPRKPPSGQIHQMLRGTARALKRIRSASSALALSSIQIKNPLLRGIIGEIRNNPSDPLSVGFARYTDVFGSALPYQIEAGETAGNLSDVFSRAATQYAERIAMTRALLKSLSLPILNAGAFFCILLVFIIWGIPIVVDSFMKRELVIPWDFRVMMQISESLRSSPIGWVGLVLAGVFAWINRAKIIASAPVEWFLMKCPVIGDIYRKAMIYIYFTELADLIDANVGIKKSYDIIIGIARNRYFKQYFGGVQTALIEGLSDGEAFLQQARILDTDGFYIAGSIGMSESTGDLTNGIRDFCGDFKDEVKFKMEVLPAFLMIASTLTFALVAGVVVVRVWMGIMDGMDQELSLINGFINAK